jgi:hypothetical protein
MQKHNIVPCVGTDAGATYVGTDAGATYMSSITTTLGRLSYVGLHFTAHAYGRDRKSLFSIQYSYIVGPEVSNLSRIEIPHFISSRMLLNTAGLQ